MSKTVDRGLYRNYLQKAQEMLEVGQYSLRTEKNNAAVTASVHCAINAIDALAVYYFGKRHAGRHEDALKSIQGALDEADRSDIAKQFAGLIGLKNEAEYQTDLMNARQASDALRRASRILSKVRKKLP
ncbi:MAG: HEPN domain-containing protein [Nitrososphaerota archaeon]|nr:HEPN domain-containing protein [Nitrososphaerota archaeon]